MLRSRNSSDENLSDNFVLTTSNFSIFSVTINYNLQSINLWQMFYFFLIHFRFVSLLLFFWEMFFKYQL